MKTFFPAAFIASSDYRLLLGIEVAAVLAQPSRCSKR